MDFKNIVAFHQDEENRKNRKPLGNHRGPCRSPYPPFEGQDEKKIKGDVHERREDEEVERPPRVSQCAEDSRADVVENQEADSCKVNLEVRISLLENAFRDGNQTQHKRRQGNSHHRHNQADEERAENRRVNRILHTADVFRAESLGNHNLRSSGKSREKAYYGEDELGGSSDGRKCVLPKEFPHHETVHRVVELLEHVSGEERKGKSGNLGENGSLGHVEDS